MKPLDTCLLPSHPSLWGGAEASVTKKYQNYVSFSGGGINPSNLEEILRTTGCSTAHASARVAVSSPMLYKRQGCKMGTNSSEFDLMVTCAKTVRALVDLLDTHNRQTVQHQPELEQSK